MALQAVNAIHTIALMCAVKLVFTLLLYLIVLCCALPKGARLDGARLQGALSTSFVIGWNKAFYSTFCGSGFVLTA